MPRATTASPVPRLCAALPPHTPVVPGAFIPQQRGGHGSGALQWWLLFGEGRLPHGPARTPRQAGRGRSSPRCEPTLTVTRSQLTLRILPTTEACLFAGAALFVPCLYNAVPSAHPAWSGGTAGWSRGAAGSWGEPAGVTRTCPDSTTPGPAPTFDDVLPREPSLRFSPAKTKRGHTVRGPRHQPPARRDA